jgi:hypothetical protein
VGRREVEAEGRVSPALKFQDSPEVKSKMDNEITKEQMNGIATDIQRRAVETQIMYIRVRGDQYKLAQDGKHILIQCGDLVTRVDRKGKLSW